MIKIEKGKVELQKEDVESLKECLQKFFGEAPDDRFLAAMIEAIVKYGIFSMTYTDICSMCSQEKPGKVTFSKLQNKAIFVCSDCSTE